MGPEQVRAVEHRVHRLVRKTYPQELADRIWSRVQSIGDVNAKLQLLTLIAHDLRQGEHRLTSVARSDYAKYDKPPVDIFTFLTDPYFMDGRGVIYPEVLRELIEINSGKYVECVFTGGIGSGKTTAALYTMAYQLYLLSCMTDPHKSMDLDPATEIMFVFQSVRKRSAEEVGYNRFRSMLERSPYFMREFPFNTELKSKMVFRNRIEIQPVSGMETATIGENVMGGVIDELNYMAVIEQSKTSVDGGTYDQAVALYNSIARRRKSRFMRHGELPGILCLVSSRRYPGQFTDRKEEEAKTDPTIYVYDKCTWDVKPDAYCGETFKIFVGDEYRKPRVLEDGEFEQLDPEDQRDRVKDIPIEHRGEFDRDIINALREVAGVSTLATHPFIMNTDAITDCVGRESIFTADSCDFVHRKIQILPKKIALPTEPRWAHVDLGLSSDSAGIAIGWVSGFERIERGDAVEILPKYVIDGVLNVDPPKGGEIQFWKIRNIFYKLRELGMNLVWITYDSYQSVDSLQILHQQGFRPGKQSMDKDRRPYEVLKSAIYDGRLAMPDHQRLRRELASLEDIPDKGKIDHPPNGSKDCADALAGVVYGLMSRLEIWHKFGVPTSQIPPSVMELMSKSRQSGAGEAYQETPEKL